MRNTCTSRRSQHAASEFTCWNNLSWAFAGRLRPARHQAGRSTWLIRGLGPRSPATDMAYFTGPERRLPLRELQHADRSA
eukprot:13453107-Alexandrium_andersonii.AAC.1